MNKNNYEAMTDEELIQHLRDGEEEIMDYILEKHKHIVKAKASSMYLIGADKQDLIQEGMIGLFKAVRDYDAGRDASFSTFADLCVTRTMYSAIQSSNRKKHTFLNTYISLYSTGNQGEGDKQETDSGMMMDLMSSAGGLNPEQVILDRESVRMLEEAIDAELSELEKQVLDLHLTGMGYVEIAKVLGRDEKSTDNALWRIRSKIRKILLEGEN